MASTYSANGTVSIQDTNYAIPAGAYFVSNAGSDYNSGTQASPWLTVGHAISQAPSGSTIVLRGGTYREGGLSVSGKQLTLQSYPHEQAWLKGSAVITGWTQAGNCWMHTGWPTQFNYLTDTRTLDPNHPLAGWPDMVFVNGASLTCAHAPNATGGQGSVGSGTFYIDYTNKTIYIGNNPVGATVEVAQYQNGLSIHDGCKVLGLGFQHYATSYQSQYAFNVFGANCVVENNTVAWCATGGMNLNTVTNLVLRGNTCAFNGEQGVGAWQCNRSTISSNYFAYNNIRNFSTGWDAAGIKITSSSGTAITNNLIDHNDCGGAWCDIQDNAIDLVNNICLNNNGSGLYYEWQCTNGIIANNLIIGTLNGPGIGVVSGTNVQIWNNTLSNNNQCICMAQDPNGSPDATGVVIRNNVFSDDAASGISNMINARSTYSGTQVGAMVVAWDFNAYYRANANSPANLFVVNGNNAYPTMAAFHNAYPSYEANGISQDGGSSCFTATGSGNSAAYYALRPGVPMGTALPAVSGYRSASIAAAIGLSSYAGGPVNRGILPGNIGPASSGPPAATTTTSLTVNPNPIQVSGTVTFSAAVTASDSSVPTGTVGFYVSTAAGSLGGLLNAAGVTNPVPLDSRGIATIPAWTNGSSPWSGYITAVYAGSGSNSLPASQSAQVTMNVNAYAGKIDPVITSVKPQPIIFGTALSAQQLNATANVPGIFTYSPVLGTVLQNGPAQTLSCTFTPTDTTTYNVVTTTTTIDVWKAFLITQ